MTNHTDTVVHSHSSLNMFETCPKKYFEIKVAKSCKQNFGPKSPAQIEGDAFHKAVENCLLMNNPELPPKFSKENYVKSYRHIVSIRKSIANATIGEYISVPELSLAVNNQFQEVGYFGDEPKLFRGRIDYCCAAKNVKSGEGKHDIAALIDLKTGKSAYSSPTQLERMALLLFSVHPHINHIKAAYIWVNENAALEKHSFSRDKDYENLKKDLMYDIGNMSRCEKAGNWPAIQSGLCKNYCPVPNSVCPHSGKRG